MKKALFFMIPLMGVCLMTQAQEIGVRLGDVTGGNVAVDGVFSTSEFSRIHADVSFGNGGLGVDALWDFIYKPMGEDGFNWYAGVGPTVFLGDPFILAAAGELGIEYRFADAPVSLSVDWRPTLTLVETTDMFFDRFGFNIRYIINR